MSNDSIELLCDHCGQTFSAFLHQMADQNQKVVCPNCRQSRDCSPAKGTQSGVRSDKMTKQKKAN